MTEYHDYVIKEGRFIGAFEEMYRDCEDPWHQDQLQPVSREIALLLLRDRTYRRILDLGCGKGRFTNQIQTATGGVVTGVDISPTAVSIARTRYPDIEFLSASVPPLNVSNTGCDLVVVGELLWYVLPQLALLLSEIQRVLVPDGRCLVIQQFYRQGLQQYGRDVMETPEELIKMLPMELVHHVEVVESPYRTFVALFEKSARRG